MFMQSVTEIHCLKAMGAYLIGIDFDLLMEKI